MKYDVAALTDSRPTRRAVTRAAAWSVPVIAVATTAPAYAASPCDPRTGQTLDWDGSQTTYSRTNVNESVARFDPDGNGPVPVLKVDVTSTYTGNMRSGAEFTNNGNNNLTVASAVGGLGISGLTLEQSTTSSSPAGWNDRGAYTFKFSRPVSNLSFTLTDIDANDGDFLDILALSPGYRITSQADTLRKGTLNGNDVFYQLYYQNEVNNTSGSGGNLGVAYAGPISEFTITYSNYARSFTTNVDTNQAIYITDLTFDYTPC